MKRPSTFYILTRQSDGEGAEDETPPPLMELKPNSKLESSSSGIFNFRNITCNVAPSA